MARIKLTLEAQLKKYKISKERFEQEKKALGDLNYSSEQVEKLILRVSSANTVKALLRLHTQLIRLGETPDTTLNHEDLCKIASVNGGSNNLEAIIHHYPVLLRSEFTKAEVIKIVAHAGGSKNLEAVQHALPALQALHFTKEEVVKMVAHQSGSKNLEAVQQAFPALQALRFTKEDVVKMVAHPGGSKNLEVAREYYEELVQKDYSQNEIRAQLTLDVKRQALELFSKGQSLKARELFLIATPSERLTQEQEQTTQEQAQILSLIKKRERPFDEEQPTLKKPRFFSERSERTSIQSVEQESSSAQSISL